MPDLVLSFAEARSLVESQAASLQPCGTERLPLLQTYGRVLAEPITADRDFPPFPRSTRDGYAVRAADVSRVPVSLSVQGEIRAGQLPGTDSLTPGCCFEIMTGAPLPAGANAVAMVEYTERQGDTVTITRAVSAGENFVPAGAEARAGQVLLAPGTRMNHAAIAVAASTGHAQLQVYARPTVAILATGDELVAVDAQPGPAQIRNSNSYSLAAQVAAAGGAPEILPTAPDNEQALKELIARGLQSDLLLITGGVSMGRFDLVEQGLARFGAEFFFTGARIQPGRPVVFGRVPCCARMFFGLPGNPVSTMVTFDLFVRPVLDALCGAPPGPLQFLQVRLKSEFHTKPGLTRFLPARLTGESGHSEVELVRWHGSGDIAAAATANCYLVVPPERDKISAGEAVSVLLQNAWF